MRQPRTLDLFAVAASSLAVVMLGVYIGVMRGQDDQPLSWVVAILVLGAALTAYGAVVRLPYRAVALGVAIPLLGGLGLLAILSIGAPIVLAAALTVVAFARVLTAPRVG